MSAREPRETRAPRMGALARLPVFLSLQGKRAVLAGGSEAAAWKAELLSAAGASVEVFAEDICEALVALADEPPGGAVTLYRRPWTSLDLKDAAIAIGAFDNDENDAGTFAAAARAAGVPVNVVDKPALLRFLLRLHRQSFSLSYWHLHRRRRAGVRAGDPRQAGSVAAAGFRRLGGRRRALARRR